MATGVVRTADLATCPNCQIPLRKTQTRFGVVYACARCGGRASALAVLRKAGASSPLLRELWRKASAATDGSRRCPHCNKAMAEESVAAGDGSLKLDLCSRCAVVWFDRGEYESMPQSPPPAPEQLSPKARECMAVMQIAHVRERSEAEDLGGSGPPEVWQWLPGFLGLPVEFDAPSLASRPWVTWGIGALLVAVFAATAGDLDAAVAEWGFVPTQWFRHGGLTLVTSFLLHGGLFHLVSNLYFFIIFGDNVEDDLGRAGFVYLLAAAHLAGALVHGCWHPNSMAPCVGASAGISGVLGYYGVTFPHAKLGFMWRWFYVFRWVRMPAVVALLLFLLVQAVGTLQQVSGFGRTSYLAHLGGLVIGIATAFTVRHIRKQAAWRAFSARNTTAK